jgi:hypothetical protein
VVPPGSSPRSVMVICVPLAVVYAVSFASCALAVAQSAKPTAPINNFITSFRLLLFINLLLDL